MCEKCKFLFRRGQTKSLQVLRKKIIPLKVGMTTLVGIICDEFPIKHGNCCSLSRHPCRNMNSENVDEARIRWPELSNGVEVEILEDNSCRVIDSRLPVEWKRHFCTSCGYFEDDEMESKYIESYEKPSQNEKLTLLKTKRSMESGLDVGYIYAPYRVDEKPIS